MEGPAPTRRPPTGPWARLRLFRKPLTYAALVGLSMLVVAAVVSRGQAGYRVTPGGDIQVQDFASHLVFARGVWHRDWVGADAASAYSVEGHLRLMSAWMQRDATEALPFGYSPTMLWLLLPLSVLPIPAAFAVWTLCGALAAAWLVSSERVHPILGLVGFLTPIAIGAFALGQTGVLATAGLFLMAVGTLGGEAASRPTTPGRDWVLVVGLWALTAKPPLALAAGVALLAVGRAGPVLLAGGLTALTTLVVTPWLGWAWTSDYLHLLSHYDRVAADPAFAWSLRPDHMSNLRALLSVDLGIADNLAARAGNLAWLATSAAIVLVGRWGKLRPAPAWGLAILSYLLFCSHVSSTDELALMAVPAIVVPWAERGVGRASLLIWIAVPLALLLSPALGPAEGLRPPLLLAVEAALALWLVIIAVRKTGEPAGGRDPESLR